MSLDHLGTAFHIKTVDYGQRLISGWAAYHGNLDRVADIIDPAASQKAVARLSDPSQVGVFIAHDMSRLPVGVPVKIEARPEGLYTETKVFEGPTGDDLLGAARGLQAAGRSLGLSIGYRVHDARPERLNGKTIRRLLDYELGEYSFAAPQAIANPKALATGVKVAGGPMKVEKRGDKYHAVNAAGESMGAYDTRAAAQAACDQMDDQDGDENQKAVWDTSYVNDLPDSAFLFIESGGQKDGDGKTVPRSLRHFPYRDADGKVDLPHLRNALSRIPQAGSWLDDGQKARLQARARSILDDAATGKTVTPDAEWKSGAALDVRGFGYRLLDLSERIATQHAAMALLGEDTKDGLKIRADLRAEIKAVVADITRAVDWAETIDAGEDGRARLALLARELDLLEV